jgi:segregation and condensation protein B
VSEPETKATEVQAHVDADTSPEAADDAQAAALEAAEGDAAAEGASESVPAVGDGRQAPERLKSILESLLFASDKPLGLKRLQEYTNERDAEKLVAAIEALRADYADRGVVLHEVAGGFQFRTSPLNAYWVQQMIAGRPVRLTRAQLEVLAIAAYRQPITRSEIDEIRGVDSAGAVKTLLDRNLIRVLGKKEEPGRPMICGTTREFLEFFHLKDLKDLPTLREFSELSEESMAKVRQLDEARAAEAAEAAAEAPAEAPTEAPAEAPPSTPTDESAPAA